MPEDECNNNGTKFGICEEEKLEEQICGNVNEIVFLEEASIFGQEHEASHPFNLIESRTRHRLRGLRGQP